jgi:hypothetical protein
MLYGNTPNSTGENSSLGRKISLLVRLASMTWVAGSNGAVAGFVGMLAFFYGLGVVCMVVVMSGASSPTSRGALSCQSTA